MVVQVKEGYEASAFTYGRHIYDENVSLNDTYRNVLLIDSRRIRQSVIVFNNKDTQNIEYQVFGNAKYDPVLLQHIKDPTEAVINSDDVQWVNLISVVDGATGEDYNHQAKRVVGVGRRFYESFTNEWFSVLVRARTPTGGTTLAIWHRGQS